MNFDYSDFQTMLIESARKVVDDRCDVETWRAHREFADGVNPELWALFGELGWLALPLPAQAGGLEGSMEDIVLLMGAIGRGLFVEPIVSTVVVGAFILQKVGGHEHTLGEIAGGALRIALAHEEVGSRYGRLHAFGTTARKDANGFLVEGRKSCVVDAPSAHRMIVSATLDGEFALFLIDSDIAGLERQSYKLIDGSWASDVVLSDVRLSADALLAKGDSAASLLDEALDRGTIALLGQAMGSMEAAVEVTTAYMKERHQFNQAIATFQSLQHMAVDMLVGSYQARSAIYQALAHMHGDAAERGSAVSAAKVAVAQGMSTVSKNGVQLHGGYGLTDEYAISHHYRRQFVIEKTWGDSEFHLSRLAALT
jgi:alkylation response protein AidB-like acyl-CoA dehydrogenase